jgi:hypothetical protein
MDWHPILGIIAGILEVAALVPYLHAVFKRKTQPNVVSWGLWTIVVAITALGLISAGASWSLFLLIGAFIANVLVTILCFFGYGYRKFGTVDKISMVLAILAIIGWQATANPLIAIVLAVGADCIAYIPTIVKVYREPRSENPSYWMILILADVLALISLTKFDLANMIFPIAYGVMASLILITALLSKGYTSAVVKNEA